MKKFYTLTSCLLLSFGLSAQVSIFHENFDPPSGPDSVTTAQAVTSSLGTPATKLWNDTNFISTSGTMSYHVSGTLHNDIYFTTSSFSTVGYPYVFLSFNHITKLYAANQARVQVSVDGGTTWAIVEADAYRGISPLFNQNFYFNEGAYSLTDLWEFNQNTTPQQSWWVTEKFDLRGYAYDTIAMSGYSDVKLRFSARFILGSPGSLPNNQIFYAGWFVDDINVIGSTCELDAPKVAFTGNGVCMDKPENAVVQDPSGNYPVSVIATDKGAGMDRVELIYTYNNVTDTIIMTLVNTTTGKYTGVIPNIAVSDTVTYYIEAYDQSCPNVTRLPESFLPDIEFYVAQGLPSKCGSPYCGAFPTTIKVDNLPWVETFEGTRWGAGNNGSSTNTNSYRGSFPTYPEGYWTVAPSAQNGGVFAWSVANGPTSTPQTGPAGNHTPGGSKYIYTEGSEGTAAINTTQLITPCIDLTNNTKCLAFEFYYHLFGADIANQGRLRVDVDTSSGSATNQFQNAYTLTRIRGERQSSTGDPWKKAVISLEPFNGKFIKLRFVGVKFGSGEKYDMAIDDLRIFEPDPVDVELIGYEAPINGYCNYTSNEDVTVVVRNNGCDLLTSVPISFQVNQGPIVNTNMAVSLGLGEDTVLTLSQGANLSATGNHQVKVWSNAAGDSDLSSDTVVGPVIENVTPISTFPYIEDFEGGTVGTQNTGNSNWRFDDGLDPTYRWQIGEGLTPTRETGPMHGYYYGGKYLYTETGNTTPNISTYLRTICVDLTGVTNPTLDFFYHQNGADFGNLEVQVSLGTQSLENWTTIPMSGLSSSNNRELTDWHFKRVDLNAYAGSVIKLRFKATRAGISNKADFAIDNIAIYSRQSTDAGAFLLTSPGTAVPTTSPYLVPDVRVINYGTTNLVNPKINIDITPLCGTNPQTTTYSQTVTGSVSPGSFQNFSLSSINIPWPVGEFEAKVYTDVANDAYSFNDTIARRIVGLPIYAIPFSSNFDDCDYSKEGFAVAIMGSSTTLLQWEKGPPQVTGGAIRTPRSSPNIWATNLDGPYLPGTEEYLRAPIFEEFDTVVGAEFRFYQNLDLSAGATSNSSAAVVEYFANGSWKALGGDIISTQIGLNWYGSKYGSQNTPVLGGPGWVGNTFGQWIPTRYPLYLFNQSQGQLISRFTFVSTEAVTTPVSSGGWGIDDFELYVPPQNSASPVAVRTQNPIPFPAFDQEMIITIENTGAKKLDNVLVEVHIDGSPIGGKQLVQPNLLIGQRYEVKYDYVWPGGSVTTGVHDVMVITSRPNGKGDNLPIDDTLNSDLNSDHYKFKIVVPDEIDMTSAGIDTMCNNFEGNSGYAPWFTRSSTIVDDTTEFFVNENSSWQSGTPAQFGGAYSGFSAWSTYLDTNYHNFERSSLFGPVYILDSNQTYTIDFWHWINSEPNHDGGNFEVSFNGGYSWEPIGYLFPGSNWYNTEFVTSLEIIQPGWTGNSGGWVNSVWSLEFAKPIKAVFRFKFASDAEITKPGWAIDDFCFYKDTVDARQRISEGEHQPLPEDAVVAELRPNPTYNISKLPLYVPKATEANVVVVNSIGQIMENRNVNLNHGVNEISFDGGRWDAGMYIIKIRLDGELIVRKLVIQH